KATITYRCRPYARGVEYLAGSVSETTLPVAILTVDAPPGDAPALGRAVITDDQTADRLEVVAGLQVETYDPANTAALFYEAEDLTRLGSSSTNSGPTGKSGTGVVRNTTLTTSYQALLSTEIDGVGHMTHVGSYRVFARIQLASGNTGEVSVAFEWRQG